MHAIKCIFKVILIEQVFREKYFAFLFCSKKVNKDDCIKVFKKSI